MSGAETKPGLGHNSVGQEAAGHLRALAGRIQRLDEEISSLNADKADIYREAKGLGFDPNGLRAAIRWMRDPTTAAERDAVTKVYVEALESAAPAAAEKSGTPAATRRAPARGAA